jgi:hypothetical protein
MLDSARWRCCRLGGLMDQSTYIWAGVAVLAIIVIALAFARKWVGHFFVRHGENEIHMKAPTPSSSVLRLRKSRLKNSSVKSKNGETDINKSRLKDSEVENG